MVFAPLLIPEAREQELNVLHGLGVPPLRLSHELDRALSASRPVLSQHEVTVILLGQLVQNSADQVLGILAVLGHVVHDHGDIDILAIGVSPAIVVGGHANHLVGQLGLPGQLGLGQSAHVDHASAPGPVHVALGSGGELRTLHADDNAAGVERDPVALHRRGASLHDGSELGVERVGKPYVANHSALEEGEWADPFGAINDLVGNDKVHRLDVLLEGADGREGDDCADANGAEGGDVGAGWDLVRGDLVMGAMAAEECDGNARVLEDGDGGGRDAPRGGRGDDGDGVVAGQFGEAGAADDGDVDGA